MKQDKTRKDFFLEEDYDSYCKFHAFVSYIHEIKVDTKTRDKLRELALNILSTAYKSGYANAKLDTAAEED